MKMTFFFSPFTIISLFQDGSNSYGGAAGPHRDKVWLGLHETRAYMLEPTAANQVINCAKETSDIINHSAQGSHTSHLYMFVTCIMSKSTAIVSLGHCFHFFMICALYLFELAWQTCHRRL